MVTSSIKRGLKLLRLLAEGLVNCGDDRFINFHNLGYMVAIFGTEALDNFMAEKLTNPVSFAKYRSLRKGGENMISSVIETASTALDALDDPVLQKIFSGNTLDIKKLREEKGVLYIICPASKTEFYSLALNLIYEEIFQELMETEIDEKTQSLAMLMDEAGNQYIQGLETILTTIRDKNVSVSLILQDFSQLQDKYGEKKAKTMLGGGLSSRLIFPGLSFESCKMFSEVLGLTISKGDQGKIEKKAQLMTPDELRMLDGVILIHGAERPVKLEMTPYYEDSRLLRWSEMPPHEIEAREPGNGPELFDFGKFGEI